MALELPAVTLCPLRAFTGLDCPLCGATRATLALVRGDVGGALDLNALYVILLPLALLLAVYWWKRRRVPAWLATPAAMRAVLAASVAYMVVRNLPFAPFAYLGT